MLGVRRLRFMSLRIPDELADKANSFPESSYGAITVTLILSDGRRIENVILAWASEIVKLKGRDVVSARDVGFTVSEIVDVGPES
jgi:hypothetical protein